MKLYLFLDRVWRASVFSVEPEFLEVCWTYVGCVYFSCQLMNFKYRNLKVKVKCADNVHCSSLQACKILELIEMSL